MPISLTKACTNDEIIIGSLTGVSNTNDTKRTSIKQQQQEEKKLHSQVEIDATSSEDSEATNECFFFNRLCLAISHWFLTDNSFILTLF